VSDGYFVKHKVSNRQRDLTTLSSVTGLDWKGLTDRPSSLIGRRLKPFILSPPKVDFLNFTTTANNGFDDGGLVQILR
jgi:hypothetical protein